MSPRKPAPRTRIQKSGNGHSYYLDGEKVPGVTTILGNGIPKNALQGWAARCVAETVVNGLAVARTPDGRARIVADEMVADMLAWNETRGNHAVKVGSEPLPRLALAKILENVRYRDLDEASGKGTKIHGISQHLANGEEVTVEEYLRGHAESYVKFLDDWDPTNALLERVVINRRWRYMGKFDLVATFPGTFAEDVPAIGKRAGEPIGTALLDIKTSRSGIFPETALQLAGYKNGETMLDGVDPSGEPLEVPVPVVDWCGAIHVRADGYDVYGLTCGEREFRTFLYAKQVGEWLDWKEGPAATVKSDSLPAPVTT